eukprot:4917321-Prymnesium_polylepis.1
MCIICDTGQSRRRADLEGLWAPDRTSRSPQLALAERPPTGCGLMMMCSQQKARPQEPQDVVAKALVPQSAAVRSSAAGRQWPPAALAEAHQNARAPSRRRLRSCARCRRIAGDVEAARALRHHAAASHPWEAGRAALRLAAPRRQSTLLAPTRPQQLQPAVGKPATRESTRAEHILVGRLAHAQAAAVSTSRAAALPSIEQRENATEAARPRAYYEYNCRRPCPRLQASA